ncbi:ATP-binding cassette domain-containing protein [Methylocella sp. CPCC 101449]|uniref:ATP-binding cassette domain-containing protein n=1 Tax=Methylocella sp. CPCC 101449 TaxID=2987531 RepID=UPI002891E246|nr:ATP-binding cassette domain-containing protein [Methylocella sp. CPCC 101449]MDT2021926.1 ATP-binding cassette domain-containing protein [Methylocella sp. CPCC 101449]
MKAPPRPNVRARWRWTLVLAFTAVICALLLSGLSAWFLGAVAIAGLSPLAYTFNFHMPAALVRLFAVGRTAAKYGERIAGHSVALQEQLARRVELFSAMASAPSAVQTGWQFGRQERLTDYLDDVEDVDYGRLRVDLPALTAAAGVLLCLIASVILAPLAILPIAVLLLIVVALSRRFLHNGATNLAEARRLRAQGAGEFGASAASVMALQAEKQWAPQSQNALARFTQAESKLLDLRLSQSVVDAIIGLFGPLAALSVIGAAWLAGKQADALLAPAFLAFAWLALGETIQAGSKMLTAQLRREAARAEIAKWTEKPTDVPVAAAITNHHASKLAVTKLQRRSPNGRSIGTPLNACFRQGQPTVIAGTSGSGKTSLLKQIAGWVGHDAMAYDDRVLSPAERQSLSFFCLHDAAILADTVRANLFAPAATDEDLWQALQDMEIDGRIEALGGLDAWITQEVLSLGEAQRLNLARAVLSDRPIVLLDEPTEHLDEAQGQRILTRLLDQLGERIVILSSHRVADEGLFKIIRLD